ncbi:MAG: sugar transferase [Deltaproteobacteria bacterium]|nr:sugar transferase [Deltaproteobacteria bacterium]
MRTVDPRSGLQGKYLLDRVGALLVFLVVAPLMGLIALAIKLGDGGDIFYKQERVGLGGKPFSIWKFRTMVPDAFEIGKGYIPEGADLITNVGKFLRRTSLDELPQILNILAGDMSFVGPRPTLLSQVKRYTANQMRRLEVKPGVAGLAQLHGRHSLPWSKRIAYDVEYVDRAGVLYDLLILLRTPWSLLFGGDYTNHGDGAAIDDLGPAHT